MRLVLSSHSVISNLGANNSIDLVSSMNSPEAAPLPGVLPSQVTTRTPEPPNNQKPQDQPL